MREDLVVRFELPGDPVPMARRRTKDGSPVARDYIDRLQAAARRAMDGRTPFDMPVRLGINAVWPCPKFSRDTEVHRWNPARTPPQVVTEVVFRALRGIVWTDDTRVCDMRLFRVVGGTGEASRLEVVAHVLLTEGP